MVSLNGGWFHKQWPIYRYVRQLFSTIFVRARFKARHCNGHACKINFEVQNEFAIVINIFLDMSHNFFLNFCAPERFKAWYCSKKTQWKVLQIKKFPLIRPAPPNPPPITLDPTKLKKKKDLCRKGGDDFDVILRYTPVAYSQ